MPNRREGVVWVREIEGNRGGTGREGSWVCNRWEGREGMSTCNEPSLLHSSRVVGGGTLAFSARIVIQSSSLDSTLHTPLSHVATVHSTQWCMAVGVVSDSTIPLTHSL